jgi:hypothetical protein
VLVLGQLFALGWRRRVGLVQRFLGPNHNDGVNADTVFPHEAPVSRIASK